MMDVSYFVDYFQTDSYRRLYLFILFQTSLIRMSSYHRHVMLLSRITSSPVDLFYHSTTTTMATSCTFHGIIGISSASPYMMDNKNFWRYQAFIATPDGDFAVSVFAFRGNTASVEHGIYLIDARAVVGIILDENGHSSQTLHLYVIDVCFHIELLL